MCETAIHRIRILQELTAAARDLAQLGPTTRDQLTDRCLDTLRDHFMGLCPDEVLQAKASSFATWYSARQESGKPFRTNSPVVQLLAA